MGSDAWRTSFAKPPTSTNTMGSAPEKIVSMMPAMFAPRHVPHSIPAIGRAGKKRIVRILLPEGAEVMASAAAHANVRSGTDVLIGQGRGRRAEGRPGVLRPARRYTGRIASGKADFTHALALKSRPASNSG